MPKPRSRGEPDVFAVPALDSLLDFFSTRVNEMPNIKNGHGQSAARTVRKRAEGSGLPRSKPAPVPKSAPQSWLRPQSIVFTLLAEHLLDRELALFSGSFIEVLERVGISEHATRATLTRMAERGLLERQRHGRKIYFGMTPRCTAILEDGRTRIWHTGVINTHEPRTWTLLAFSLPESLRRTRYDLRARLSWAGFGPMQNGVWLAPAEVDVAPIIDELGLAGQARVFHVQPAAPTRADSVISETFDLDGLAKRYRAFCAAWEPRAGRDESDPLVLTLRLSTQWLRIIRDDPRVPVHLLPAQWPAIAAQKLFRTLHGTHAKAATVLAGKLLDLVPAAR
jgi:phenylacetic acid degradation operon negative regulatory protein